MDDEPRQLTQRQFTLSALFLLTAFCGLYVAVEKATGGRFGIATLLVLITVVPVLYVIGWIARALVDAGPLGTLAWIAGVAALIVLGLLGLHQV